MKNNLFKKALCLALTGAMLAGSVSVGVPFDGAIVAEAADKSEAESIVNQAATVVSDSGTGLEKGRTVEFDHPMYTFKYVIKSVSKSEAVVEFDALLKSADEWTGKGYNSVGLELGLNLKFNGGTASFERRGTDDSYTEYREKATVSLKDLKSGKNYFEVEVRPSLRTPYPELEWVEGKSSCKMEFSYIKGATISLATAKVGTNYVTLGTALKGSESGTVVYYRKKGDSSWTEKNFKNGASMKVSGLKASTVYQFKAQNYVGEDKSAETGVETINTASEAHTIQSVKVTGVKQYQVTVPGEWKTNWGKTKWYPAHKEWRTKFKVTVTLKNKPKNVKEMYISVSKAHLSLKKNKTASASFVFNGKQKGKSYNVGVYSYANSYMKGKSKVAKKKVTIR